MPLTVFHQTHHLAGVAPDTTPLVIRLNPRSLRLDIFVLNNPALITFSDDGIFFSSPRLFPAGVLASVDQLVSAITIVNQTVGSPATFDITAFYNPREVVGVPVETPPAVGR